MLDRPGAKELTPRRNRGPCGLRNVSFAFRRPDGELDPPAIKNINLTIEPGQRIGILGATGAGKSALVNLIPRFYDVTEGRITIDGIDVRDIPQENLRQIVGIALQEAVLFQGDMTFNLKFGNPEAEDEVMYGARQAADAYGFVSNLPQQWEAPVARRGYNFSGGQRQRLAITRTLATKPRVLILDDSTSALDVATESRVQEEIPDFTDNVTTIYIAQRISAVIDLDRIFLMEFGEIVAEGTHEELLASNELYQQIYESQLGAGMHSRWRRGGSNDRISATDQTPTLRSRLEGRRRFEPPKGENDTLDVARRLFTYMVGEENRTKFIIAMVVRVAALVALIVIPLLTGMALNMITSGEAPSARSARCCSSALLAAAIYMGMSWYAERVFSQLATTGLYKLQCHLFDHMQTLSLSFFDRQPLGELMSRVTNDTEAVSLFYESAVAPLIRSVFQVLMIIICHVDHQLAVDAGGAAHRAHSAHRHRHGAAHFDAGLHQTAGRVGRAQRFPGRDHLRPQGDHQQPTPRVGRGQERPAGRRRLRCGYQGLLHLHCPVSRSPSPPHC